MERISEFQDRLRQLYVDYQYIVRLLDNFGEDMKELEKELNKWE